MPFRKGNHLGRRFEPGNTPWIKGRSHSGESKELMRLGHTGKTRTKEHCDNLSLALKGRVFSEEHRRRLTAAGKGRKILGMGCVEKLDKVCPVCGTEFQVIPSRSAKTFCQRSCATVGRKKGSYDRRGSNNPKWRGGVTPLRRTIWKSKEYDTWRRNIFVRDARRCQGCGTKRGELQVHHSPYEFSDILCDFHIKTMDDAIGCKALWDENNGKVLCVECHRKTYRFKGNQFRK